MAQAYGSATTRNSDTGPVSSGAQESETSTLLPPGTAPDEGGDTKDGHASLVSCVGNLTNTIIGSGERRFQSARLQIIYAKPDIH